MGQARRCAGHRLQHPDRREEEEEEPRSGPFCVQNFNFAPPAEQLGSARPGEPRAGSVYIVHTWYINAWRGHARNCEAFGWCERERANHASSWGNSGPMPITSYPLHSPRWQGRTPSQSRCWLPAAAAARGRAVAWSAGRACDGDVCERNLTFACARTSREGWARGSAIQPAQQRIGIASGLQK